MRIGADRAMALQLRQETRVLGPQWHASVVVPDEMASQRLTGALLHDPYRSFAEHLATIDRYTTIMAEQLRAEGRRARLADLLLRPPLRFLDFYVWRLGCLDGWRGLLLALLAAHYVRLKYAKLFVGSRV